MDTNKLQAARVETHASDESITEVPKHNGSNGCVAECGPPTSVGLIRRNSREAHLHMLEHGRFTDVTFVVGKTKEKINCHSVFLMARSPVFEEMLRSRETNQAAEIRVVDDDDRMFKLLLKFLYADVFPDNVTEALDVLNLGSKYKVEQLMEDSVINLTWKMTPRIAISVFKAAECYGLNRLKDAAGNVLVVSLPTVLSGSDWTSLDELLWLYLLERDDLKLSEFQLFECIVRWGKSHLKDQDNVDELRDKLTNLLPLIRFPVMSPEEFSSVASMDLLPEKTTVQVFRYLNSSEETRKTIAKSLPFMTSPRRTVLFANNPFASTSFALASSNETSASPFPAVSVPPFGVSTEKKAKKALAAFGNFGGRIMDKSLPSTTKLSELESSPWTNVPSSTSDSQEALIKSMTPVSPSEIIPPEMTPAEKIYVSFYDKQKNFQGFKCTKFSMADLGECMRFNVVAMCRNGSQLRGQIYLESVTICWPQLVDSKPNSYKSQTQNPAVPWGCYGPPPLRGKRPRYFSRSMWSKMQRFQPLPIGSNPPSVSAPPFNPPSQGPTLPMISKAFKLSLKQFPQSAAVGCREKKEDLVTKFEDTGIEYRGGATVTIPLRPPVQLCNGETYFLCIEETGSASWSDQYRHQPKTLLRESIVQHKTWTLNVSGIQRNDPNLFSYASTPLGEVQLIHGMEVKLQEGEGPNLSQSA